MALQKKTYTVGTGIWDSTYVGFVLTLTITENSVSQANNTSNISYELILSNPNNQYPYDVGSATRYVELVLGSHNLSQDVTGSWVFNSNTTQKVLLSGSVDIEHEDDGTSTIDIYAKMPRLRTDGLGGPQEMIIDPDESLTLTPIERIFTNTIHHVKFSRNEVEVGRETTTFSATVGESVTNLSQYLKNYSGFTNDNIARFHGRYDLPDISIDTGSFIQPAGEVTFDFLYLEDNPKALFNGQEVTSIVFNGQPIEHFIYNGIQVF